MAIMGYPIKKLLPSIIFPVIISKEGFRIIIFRYVISRIIFRCCALAQSMLTGHTPGNGKDNSDCNSRFLKAFAEKRLQTDGWKSNQCCQKLQKGDSLDPTKHRREPG